MTGRMFVGGMAIILAMGFGLVLVDLVAKAVKKLRGR